MHKSENRFFVVNHLCRFDTLEGNKVLQLDPTIDGVFGGPYPIGIDPVNIFLSDLYS